MAQAWKYSVVIARTKTVYLCVKRAVCPSVLLRVPRALRSSLTSAQHPGKPLSALYPYLHKTSFLAMGMEGLPQRSQGGARSVGDMSVGRFDVADAGLVVQSIESYQTKIDRK